ncbi:MAG: hypothetical protein PVI73_08560 [Syntrophobacterales bacterium]
MFEVTVITLSTGVYALALFGWGRLLEKFLQISWPFSLTIALGMAGWIFWGGVLNLLGLAYPLALDSIVVFGLAYSALTFFRSRKLQPFSHYRDLYLSKDYVLRLLPALIVILIALLFVAYTIASPKAFNFHDDLEKYLSHPIRMLATGSLAGSTFNALGSETFGGQAFLHGFAVAHWPLGYVNTIDSVFAFVLCLMMLLSVALRSRLPFWLMPLVVMVPIFINPQYVNISSIYTATVLMLLVFLGLWLQVKEKNGTLTTWPCAAWLGLVYGALVAVKTVYLLFVIIHFTLLFIGLICISDSRKDVLFWTTKVTAFVIVFLSPWLLLYYSNWIAFIVNAIVLHTHVLDSGYARYIPKAINLFSLDPLFYDVRATLAHYTFTMILVALCSMFLFVYTLPNEPKYKMQTATEFAACVTAPILYVASIVVIAPRLLGPDEGLRYVCPAIIAAVPSTLIIASTRVSETIQGQSIKNQLLKYPMVLLVVFAMGIIGCFSSSLAERGRQALRYGSLLSFPKRARNSEYIAYHRYAFSSDAKKEVQTAQQMVPEGAVLIAWTPLSFHLDYSRNRIVDIDPAGLANPWLDFPFGKELSDGIKYFIDSGAYYVLWHYRSYAVRPVGNLREEAASPYPRAHTIGVRTQQMVEMLYDMTQNSQILGNNGSIVVFRVSDKQL